MNKYAFTTLQSEDDLDISEKFYPICSSCLSNKEPISISDSLFVLTFFCAFLSCIVKLHHCDGATFAQSAPYFVLHANKGLTSEICFSLCFSISVIVCVFFLSVAVIEIRCVYAMFA